MTKKEKKGTALGEMLFTGVDFGDTHDQLSM